MQPSNPSPSSSSTFFFNPIENLMQQFQAKCKLMKENIRKMKVEELIGNEKEREKEFMKGYAQLLELQALQIQINLFQKRMNDLRVERKKEMELPLLEYNNISCEAKYFRRDIAISKNYYSRHVEIDLPNEEYFAKKAPKSYTQVLAELEQLKGKGSTNQEEVMSKQHQLMMNRLKFELEERESLEKDIEQLKSEQEKIKQEQYNIEKYINNIPKNLATIKKTMLQFEPAINPLKHKYSDWFTAEEIDLLKQLPTPLFILYNKLMEYKQTCDNTILLSIVGDTERAKQEWDDLENSTVLTDSSIAEELNGEPKKKKLKPADSSNESFALFPLYIQLRVHLKIYGKLTASRNDEIGSYNLHPPDTIDTNKKLLIEFGYLHKSNLVVVNEAKSATSVLPTLIPGDDGAFSPNISVMSDYDFRNFERGRPYRWLQKICGLEFIPMRMPNSDQAKGNKPEEDKEYSLHYILNFFKYKQKAKRYLLHQLKSFDNLELRSEFPSCLPVSPKLESAKQIFSDYTSLTYISTIRVDKYLFEVEIYIDVTDYPLKAPHFRKLTQLEPAIDGNELDSIPEEFRTIIEIDSAVEQIRHETSASSSALYQIEKDVNYSFVSEFNDEHIYQADDPQNIEHFCLISHQIHRLMTCLAVFVETKNPDSKAIIMTNNNMLVGKELLLPLHYDERSNCFTHKLL
ncbi:hypothetical protein FDP41_008446 [Naegleria fowleri]|uniref:Uncharacterized protein n=1 Tax=Naegleria fowleri TaxID=5763 RepID=A0A6A5BK75_NAEFO|nr:uncharacterized protein FDP41_008446 [Naegleria fowleri]KAF0973239.1 hypothetical protein FDP41_008446 [Naegleria fowleri]